MKTIASSPPGTVGTPSARDTATQRPSTSASGSCEKRMMAQRLWMGSMTLSEALQASAKRVVCENTSMVRRSACCAAAVIASASSRMTTLWRPGGSVTLV